jgi:chromosome segregation ATPase
MSEKKKPAEAPAPLSWLEVLESRVHDAVARLTELAAENANLRQRLADLEKRLAKAKAEGTTSTEPEGAEIAWHREREEIRTRVHHLTQTLSTLLQDPD